MKISLKKLLLILAVTINLVWAADNMNGMDMSNMDMSNMKGMSSSAHAKMKAQNKKNASNTAAQK
jgi:hypothetical protein